MPQPHQKRFENNIARSCGINHQKAAQLTNAGYGRLSELRAATDEELLVVPGIGPGTVKKIRESLG